MNQDNVWTRDIFNQIRVLFDFVYHLVRRLHTGFHKAFGGVWIIFNATASRKSILEGQDQLSVMFLCINLLLLLSYQLYASDKRLPIDSKTSGW